MFPTMLFLGLFAYSQAQTCVPQTAPIGSFGQGVPRIDGTMVQEGSPYSMIDIDGAAQMPAGIITGLEYRVFRLDRVIFQVWKPLDIVQGRFELMGTVELNPTEVEEVIEVKGLNFPVETKYRWGFSYNGTGLNVPVKYSIALNEPNEEPYMALQCFTCAAGKTVGDTATFSTGKVQKQFRMRAMMSIVVSTCPPPTAAPTTPAPIECIPPKRQLRPESKLRSEVFTNYDPNVRPADVGQAVQIDLSIRPSQIISFDGSVLRIMLYVGQIWRDDHLAWCPEDHEGITEMKVKHSEIWKLTDLYPYSFQQNIESGIKMKALLYSDGTVDYIVVHIWDLQCVMTGETEESQNFNCSVEFGSQLHDVEQVDFKVEEGELNLALMAEHPEVKVTSATTAREDHMYPCCSDNPYPTLSLTAIITVPKVDMD